MRVSLRVPPVIREDPLFILARDTYHPSVWLVDVRLYISSEG